MTISSFCDSKILDYQNFFCQSVQGSVDTEGSPLLGGGVKHCNQVPIDTYPPLKCAECSKKCTVSILRDELSAKIGSVT